MTTFTVETARTAVAAYHEAVAKRMAAGMTRPEAGRDVVVRDKALTLAFVAAHNFLHGHDAQC